MKFFNLAFIGSFPGPNLQRKNPYGANPLRASSLTNIVNLNVGGVKYSLFDEDIRKHPGSFFDKALESDVEKEVDVERDGNLFKFVNAFVVNGQLPRDQQGGHSLDADTIAGIKSEAHYFGLPTLQEECDKIGGRDTTNATGELSSYIKIRKYLRHFKSRNLKHPVQVMSKRSKLSSTIHQVWDTPYAQGRFSRHIDGALFKDSSPRSVDVAQLVDTAQQLHPTATEATEFNIGAFLLHEAVLRELVNDCDLEDLFEQDIDVRPNKLQIHTVGGSYTAEAHKISDEARAAGRIGTLVMILNNAYLGGELDVHLEGQKAALRTGPYSYVAMEADVQHSIRPVTSGARVSLLFDIFAKPPAAPVTVKPQSTVPRPRKDVYMFRPNPAYTGDTSDGGPYVHDYDPSNPNDDEYETDEYYYDSVDYKRDQAAAAAAQEEMLTATPALQRADEKAPVSTAPEEVTSATPEAENSDATTTLSTTQIEVKDEGNVVKQAADNEDADEDVHDHDDDTDYSDTDYSDKDYSDSYYDTDSDYDGDYSDNEDDYDDGDVYDDADEDNEDEDFEHAGSVKWRDDDLNTAPLTRATVSAEVRADVTSALDDALTSAEAVVVGLQRLYPDPANLLTSDMLHGGDRALYDLLGKQYDVSVVTANVYKEYDYDTGITGLRAGLFESSQLAETGALRTAHSAAIPITDTNFESAANEATPPVVKLVLPPILTGEHTVGASEMEYHYRRGKDQAYLVTGLKVTKKVTSSGSGSSGGSGGIAE